MNLGDAFSFEKDGIIYTERLESVSYGSGTPAIYKRLNRWQSLLRRLTPARWRRSLLMRPAELPTVTINGPSDSVGKTLAQIQAMRSAFDSLGE